MATLHKIAWGFVHGFGASSLENIDDQHSRFFSAGGTNRLELEGTTDDLLLEDGSGALALE